MTRKDFELIAKVIREFDGPVERGIYATERDAMNAVKRSMAYAFALALATTNPRFDSGRFEKACGVNDNA